MRALAVTFLLLAGCGDGGGNQGVTADQLERLSTPKPPEPDPAAGARIVPLTGADLDGAGIPRDEAGIWRMPHPVCEFERAGQVLLVATSDATIARINGALLHFTPASPAGPTGGFFEDRQISISVGRTAEAPVDAHAGFRARIIVTNRRTAAQTELGGLWRCAG